VRLLSRLANLVVLVGARLVVLGLSALYAPLKLLPTRNKIVLMSRLFASTSQDFAAVRAEINRQDATAKVVVLNHRNTNPLRVPGQMITEMYHLATARACITDSYMAAISVLRHKPGLAVIQMWHALGAIKRFGLAALGTDEGRPASLAHAMRMHQGYDWVIAGGPGMVAPFAESFGVAPAQVLPIGTPRVDLLIDPANVDARRSRIRAAHPKLGVRPVVLYAPTFRKAEPVRVEPLLDAFAGSDYDVVVALHPLDRRDFSSRPGVVQDRSFSTLDWIIVADHVISDYSAVIFDAAVIDKQLYFYAYDLDDYRNRRGLFVDYERDMPGPVEREAERIVAAVAAGADNRAAVARFREQFLAPADGHCTRRIVDLALHGRPEELACSSG
jgi:CDP-ribitol ribitolphosphotransferase / teichoic acid ribitol-phosphate polymerase